MKTLIIYDSSFGNTERLARVIAHTLRVHGNVQVLPVAEANGTALKEVDVLLIGCPTQRHGVTPAVRRLLGSIPHGSLRGVMAAAFDTRYRMSSLLSGSAAPIIARHLRKAGASLTLPPESFFVESREGPLEERELERAVQWAGAVFEKFEASRAIRT